MSLPAQQRRPAVQCGPSYFSRFIALIFVSAALCCPTISLRAEQTTTPPAVEEALQRGNAAVKQQNWKLAIKYFSEARELDKENPIALFNLALANDKVGGRELIAACWFHAYLAAKPDAANAEEVRKRILELEVKAESNIQKLIKLAKQSFKQVKYAPDTSTTTGLKWDMETYNYAERLMESLSQMQVRSGNFQDAETTVTEFKENGYYTRCSTLIRLAELIYKEDPKASEAASRMLDAAEKMAQRGTYEKTDSSLLEKTKAARAWLKSVSDALKPPFLSEVPMSVSTWARLAQPASKITAVPGVQLQNSKGDYVENRPGCDDLSGFLESLHGKEPKETTEALLNVADGIRLFLADIRKEEEEHNW